MSNGLPDEKIEALRELCRTHSGMELTHEESAEFGAYHPLCSRWKLAAAAKHPICVLRGYRSRCGMPKQAIEEFRELYRRRYGVELTDAEAETTGLRPANLPFGVSTRRARM